MDGPTPDCPPLEPLVADAWSAFQDAEVDLAHALTDRALAARTCQNSVVAPGPLLELYRLQGLVALATGDEDSLLNATLRAVVAAPNERPPERYGAALADHWTTWASRLQTRSTLSVDGSGTVWVDGNAITAASPQSLLQGEHLVQVVDGSGALIAGRVVDLSADVVVPTPGAAPAVVGTPAPAPARVAPLPAPAEAAPAGRRRPAWAFVLAAGGAALAGGGGAYAAWLNEDCRVGGAADPGACAGIRPYVNLWTGLAVGGGGLALTGAVVGAAGLPPGR